ncbi:septum formation protein Maf [Acinetobacter qingfengensis]|uniref:Nucleoside triphosphate pyrophosphatase n=1 Tax=Acinetobacter qingfengensis TaxID=1262585 RepID=A0A1E7REJ4_9GAMM|nr:Maf family protein [Acinetobacter qingfengensis]KAA8734994.1 septum formation protein Maf [Acinetobacter qingfengensis]OEY97716.1 septum formation protein Maf [Acinetobacter qingfengensis]
MSATIILASSSATRKTLLDRLQLDYLSISPDIDETPLPYETAQQLALRLSIEKAQRIAQQHPDAIVIGSDQVAYCANSPQHFIGKPDSIENAINQLQQQSGKIIHFSTGLSVQCINQNIHYQTVVPFQVQFRQLSKAEIQRYIELDQPLHCAGSFNCESLGLTLFEWMYGDDYTALMGLPVIQLCHYLRKLNILLP